MSYFLPLVLGTHLFRLYLPRMPCASFAAVSSALGAQIQIQIKAEFTSTELRPGFAFLLHPKFQYYKPLDSYQLQLS